MTKKVKIMEDKIERDIFGYCNYCKNPVEAEDEHVYKNDGVEKIYHIECWMQKNNIREEVNFDA